MAERAQAPRLLLVVGAWALLAGGFQLYAWSEMIAPLDLAARLVSAIQGSAAGPLIFIGAALLSPLLLLPAALLGGVAGLCFGPELGVLYTLIGCNLSALLPYALGRFSGRPDGLVAQLCARYGRGIQRRPFLGVILLRLSFLPYDPVNYLVGVLRVRVGPFLLANTLGSLPGVLVIVLMGSSVGQLGRGAPGARMDLAVGAAALVALCVVVGVALRRAAPALIERSEGLHDG